jgi:hypothetical protein
MKNRLICSLGSLMVVILVLSIWLGLIASQNRLESRLRVWRNGIDESNKESKIFINKIHSLNLSEKFRKNEFNTMVINYISMESCEHNLRVRENQHEFDGLPEVWREAAAFRQINKHIDKINSNISLDDMIDLRNYIGKFYTLNQSGNNSTGGHTLDCDKEFARLIESAKNSRGDSSGTVVDGDRPIH